MTLVIDTRLPPPRSVGGGLDAPQPRTRPPHRQIHRRPAPTTPETLETLTEPPTSPLIPPETNQTPEATDQAPQVADQAPEAEQIRVALSELVPPWDGATALELLRVLALKLDGHRDCHHQIHPPPGALGIDDVRSRCQELLRQLPQLERDAVLVLLTADFRGDQ